MTFFGIGGFEVLLIGAIALFVLGPKRLLEGIREGRRLYSELKRQRDALQSLITEAIDLEELKKQLDADGLAEGIKQDVAALQDELSLDQVADDVKSPADFRSGSVSRARRLNRPPVDVDSETRDAIADLNLQGSAERSTKDSDEIESDTDAGVAAGTDEVKS
ncbi:MAG: hypothetical protein IH960_00905 [Chloroflexi bacterium]|nr:hypothetical protein [Chloroflexota bacterium]